MWRVGRRAADRLVGRRRDVQRVHAALSSLESGEGTLLLVQGEPGIGKTRLLDEVDRLAREAGLPVLIGRASGIDLAGGAVPYGLLCELLMGLADAAEQAHPGLLKHREWAALADVLPLAGGAASGGTSSVDRLRVLASVRAFLQELTHHSALVLLVDDLQWADSPSLDVLSYVADVFARRPLLAMLAFRPPSGRDAQRTVAHLARSARAELLALAPLTDDEIRDQLRQLTDDALGAADVGQITALSGGIPLYVEELAMAGVGQRLPARLEMVLRGRLADASPLVRRALGAAALHPAPIDAVALAQVAGMQRADVLEALGDGVDRGLLEAPADGTYRFHHALLQQAVANGLSVTDREDGHRAWARWFVALEESGGVAQTSMIAYHWFHCGDAEEALPAVIRAGTEAHAGGGLLEAATHWRNALTLWPRVHAPSRLAGMDRDTLVVLLDEAYNFSGQWELNRELLEEEDRRRTQDPVKRLWIGLRREIVHESLGLPWRPTVAAEDVDDVLTHLERTPGGPSPRLLANCLIMLGHSGPSTPADVALRRAKIVFGVAERTGDLRLRAYALSGRATALRRHGELRAALDAAQEAVRVVEEASPVDADVFRPDLIAVLVDLGRAPAAIGEGERALAGRTDLEAGPAWEIGLSVAYAHAMTGSLDRARSLLTSLARHPSDRERAAALCCAAAVELIRGNLDRASDLIADARTRHTTDGYVVHGRETVRAWLCQCRHDVPAAREALMSVLTIPGDFPKWLMLMVATRRREDDAPAEWAQTLRTAEQGLSCDGPVTTAAKTQVAAHLTALAGREDCELWARAVSLWAEAEYRDAEAWCRLRHAEALLSEHRLEEAQQELRVVATIAGTLGSELLVGEATSLARRARLVLEPNQRRSGVEEILTAREQEVLSLVARGKTNREIAADLFMSPKTVSVHISHILQKLGVANRTEASWHARQLGLG